MGNHPLAILLRRGRGERIGDIVKIICSTHASCGVVARTLSMPESVKLLLFPHAEGCPIHEILSALDSTSQSIAGGDWESSASSYPAGNVHKTCRVDVGARLQSHELARLPDLVATIQSDLKAFQTNNQTARKSGFKQNRPFKVSDNLKGALLYSVAGSPLKLARLLKAWPDLKSKPALMILVTAQAARLDSVESVASLLELGTPVTSSIISVSGVGTMSRLLIRELVKRRQYLRDLAFEVLPPEEVKPLGLSPRSLPDISLLALCSLFTQHGFDIGSYHQGITHVQSVFHAPGLSPLHMEGLWGAGFRDIDVPDEFGHTPLVVWDVGRPLQSSLDRAEWLIHRGADVEKVVSSNSTSVCHHLCLNLMHKFTAMCYEQRRVSKTIEEALDAVHKAISRLEDSSLSLVGTAFRSSVSDSCICHCSINGCTPLVVALRHIRRTIELLSSSEDITEKAYKYDLISGVYEIILTDAIPSSSHVVRSVLRLLTFDCLGLTHTCCREDSTLDLQPFSKDDSLEIHDEERLLLIDLRTLVNRFANEYKALGIPLWDFVETHWSVKMTTYLQSKGESIDPSSLCVILASRLGNEASSLPHTNPNAPVPAGELAQSSMALIGAQLIVNSSLELVSHRIKLIKLRSTKKFHWPSATYLIRISLETLLDRLFRRQIPRGYGRLTWTCQHCQRTFTETVKEMFPGAASDWVQQLNQAQTSESRSASVITPKSTLVAKFSQAIAMLFRNVYGPGRKSPTRTTPHTLPQSGNTSQPRSVDPKYLLLGIPSYRRKDRLIHLDIQNVTTDEQLYRSMYQAYNTARRRWKWIRLRSLSHIEWKQFYIYHSDKIALNRKAEEDWPQCGRASCETGCKLAVDYEYSPRPAHVDPPIPREALIHFLENPDHAGSKMFHHDIVPKRGSFLSLGPNEHLREGWCLAFIETLSWAKIAAIEGVIGLGSLIFAVAWTETHGSGSISDAFAPSCWILALGAIVLTLIYYHEQ
ncbi:uncharacterized protein BJX67DRAFT_320342 [Aspergillus lucknowensis]|uniref:Uncharacterized protein n=1 Tax=Aspergillus lucknowensis TaxID=176173 RepID=A0ABR4LYU8_9EURO